MGSGRKGGRGEEKREGDIDGGHIWLVSELVGFVGDGDRGLRKEGGREGGRKRGRTRHLPGFLAAGFLETFEAAALGWWGIGRERKGGRGGWIGDLSTKGGREGTEKTDALDVMHVWIIRERFLVPEGWHFSMAKVPNVVQR